MTKDNILFYYEYGQFKYMHIQLCIYIYVVCNLNGVMGIPSLPKFQFPLINKKQSPFLT